MEYEIRLLPEFEEWLDGLKNKLAQETVAERLIRASWGNFRDYKTVNDGVSELRIRHGAGYRAYYTIRGRTIVFMPVGGTKRTQDRNIARAKRLAKEL